MVPVGHGVNSVPLEDDQVTASFWAEMEKTSPEQQLHYTTVNIDGDHNLCNRQML